MDDGTVDEPIACGFCPRDAFVVAELALGSPVPLCADCFARLEPDIIAAARSRRPADGLPVRRLRSTVG